MPFGLCNPPATFVRFMEQVLARLPITVALVDVLVKGISFPNHVSNLRQIFQRLQTAKLKLSPKKCLLFQREVNYLGHVVSGKGISTNPKMIIIMANPS